MKLLQGTWLGLLITGALCFAIPTGAVSATARAGSPQELESESAPAGESLAAEPAEAEATTPESSAETDAKSPSKARRGGNVERDAMVVFGQNVELKAGDTAEVVVVIGGSARIHGKVRDVVVAIGGNVEVDGEVGQEVVAVMGSIHALPSAVINGDVVSVGGSLNVDEGAKIKGQTQEVAIHGLKLPRVDWIQKWLAHCVMMLRPLAPQVGWVWIVALVYFLLYLLIAAVFRHPVQSCLDELTRRPATTFLMGLLTKLLVPLVIIILAVLVIGVVVIPFILAALLVLGLVGKVAVLEWIGFRIGGLLGQKPVEQPVVALVIGSVVLALLYMIPVVGLLTMLLLSVWSLGCAITAAFGGFRRELPERPKGPVSAAPPVAADNAAPPAAAAPTGPTMETLVAPSVEPPVMSDVLVYPKATFWERMGAAFLDVVLVVILGSIVGSFTATLIIGLAYVTGLWTWRGTTIGGIVLGLKVVRMNGEPLPFAVSLVRGLSAGFSAVVLFLGFFWIAWDRDKQGWHDKIAGTVVLRLPRGTPLLCF